MSCYFVYGEEQILSALILIFYIPRIIKIIQKKKLNKNSLFHECSVVAKAILRRPKTMLYKIYSKYMYGNVYYIEQIL